MIDFAVAKIDRNTDALGLIGHCPLSANTPDCSCCSMCCQSLYSDKDTEKAE